MKTGRLFVDVTYNEDVADLESVADALSQLVETALSTHDVLEDQGNPTVGVFGVLTPDVSPQEQFKKIIVDRYLDREAITSRADAVRYAERLIQSLHDAGLQLANWDEHDEVSYWRCPICGHCRPVFDGEIASTGHPRCGLSGACKNQAMVELDKEDWYASEP